MWQDIVISVSQVSFIVALLPSIMSTEKPNIVTSSITSFFLFLVSICFYSLDLYFSTIFTLLSGIAWAILAVQRFNFIVKTRGYCI